jgi:hypothetical protein
MMKNKKAIAPLLILIIIGAALFFLVGASITSRLSEIPSIVWIILGFVLIIWFLFGGKRRR